MNRTKKLMEAGFQAALAGKPCDAPTRKELDRGAWEQGWRAGKKQLKKGKSDGNGNLRR